jgi:hypothetical protein
MIRPSEAPYWRRLCILISLRLYTADRKRAASFWWRLGRLWARKETHMALAGYVGQLMIFGE